jgi:hypothetical protein
LRGCEPVVLEARVARSRRFKRDHLRFVVGGRPVFDAARNKDHFSGTEFQNTVPELHPEQTSPHEEEFVGLLVMVARENPLQLAL